MTFDGINNVTATFEFVQTEVYPLTVEKSRPGFGIVESDYGAIECGNNCTEYYEAGTVVTLTAIPENNSTVEWSGCNSIEGNNCTVVMNNAKTVYAVFIIEDSVSPLNGTIGTELNIITTIDKTLDIRKVNIGTKKCLINSYSTQAPPSAAKLKAVNVKCTITKKMTPEKSYPVSLVFTDRSYKTFDQLFTFKSPEIDSVDLISGDIKPIKLRISAMYFGNGKVKVLTHFDNNGKTKYRKCRITSYLKGESEKTTIECKAHKKITVDNITGITVKNKVGKASFDLNL